MLLRRISSTSMRRKVTWTEDADLDGFEKPTHFAGPPKVKRGDNDDAPMGEGGPVKKQARTERQSGRPPLQDQTLETGGLVMIALNFVSCNYVSTFRPSGELCVSFSPGPGDSDVDSDCGVDSDEGKKGAAEARAVKLRKKAGLPELDLDAMPSTIMPKVVTLGIIYNRSRISRNPMGALEGLLLALPKRFRLHMFPKN